MSAIAGKREFLCEVAGGIEVFMNCTYLSDEIHAGQDEDIEVYIKDNILEGPSFSTEKFCKAMQTIDDKTLRSFADEQVCNCMVHVN